MLSGALVSPTKNTVIPFCPEPIIRQSNEVGNDSEQSAMKRFLEKFREDHPKLNIILLADALHATGPLIRMLQGLNMSYILSVKPGSHDSLFGMMDRWDKIQQLNHYTVEEEIGDKIKKKRIHEFRYINGTLLNHADTNLSINFLEYWETTQWVDQKGRLQTKKKHFSWATDITLYEHNLMSIMRGGRARWKIENETFNTLKNQVYEFEHNFGHGYKNLSTNLANLMHLAFMFDQIQEIGCKLFNQALEKEFNKKCRLWEFIKSLYQLAPSGLQTWTQVLETVIGKWKMVPDTS